MLKNQIIKGMNRREFLKDLAVGMGSAVIPAPVLQYINPWAVPYFLETDFVPVKNYYKKNEMTLFEIGRVEEFRMGS